MTERQAVLLALAIVIVLWAAFEYLVYRQLRDVPVDDALETEPMEADPRKAIERARKAGL